MKPVVAPIVIPALFCLLRELRADDLDLGAIPAADLSRRLDESEFALRREDLAEAPTAPQEPAAIRLCFLGFSGGAERKAAIGWTRLADVKDARTPAALPAASR